MLHAVAKMHYIGELSQVQIAKQLGLSTATISRLLQRARAEGIVRIEVRDVFAPDELGAELASKLGLAQVEVVDAPTGGALTALVIDQQGGRGTFSVGYAGETLQGQATRVDSGYAAFGRIHSDVLGVGERRYGGQRGIANAAGTRGLSAQCEYLCGDFAAAEQSAASALERAADPLDRARVFALRMVQYENMARYGDALAGARQGLAPFDVALPESEAAQQAALEREIGRIQSVQEVVRSGTGVGFHSLGAHRIDLPLEDRAPDIILAYDPVFPGSLAPFHGSRH